MNQNILFKCALFESQHWFVLLLVMSLVIIFKHFSEHFISGIVVCISYFFFWPVLLILPKPSLFSSSVLPHSLFSPKHKWMHGHLGWGTWGHTLIASHITLPCVVGCRIWPGPCYPSGPSGHIRNVRVYLLSQDLQLLGFSESSEMDFSAYILIS